MMKEVDANKLADLVYGIACELQYMHNTPFGVNEISPLNEAAARIKAMQSRLESLEKEMQEQARIIGMGAERELALVAKVESLEKTKASLCRALDDAGDAMIEAGTKIESLEKDAARWRFIRDSDQAELANGLRKYTPYITDYCPHDYYAPNNIAGDAADEVVDTAMQANKGE